MLSFELGQHKLQYTKLSTKLDDRYLPGEPTVPNFGIISQRRSDQESIEKNKVNWFGIN